MGKKIGLWSSFKIDDRESCEKAIKAGAVLALVSAGVTTLFALMGIFTQPSSQREAYYLDPFLIVDAILVLILAIFLFRKSRIASTLLVAYFFLAKAITWIDVGVPRGAGMFIAVLLFAYFINAMRGTYIWNSKYK